MTRRRTIRRRNGTKMVLAFAVLLLVLGPAAVLLGAHLTVGVLFFSVGVTVLGVHGLLEGRDRAVSLVLVFVGATAALADIVRMLLG